MPTYTFSKTAMYEAGEKWGCNCGPTALAFALQKDLDFIRPAMVRIGFDDKRYTSPTMMKKALEYLNVRFQQLTVPARASDGSFETEPMFPTVRYGHILSLVRIQWTGPWTKPDANPKWAYRQTHWIATFDDWGKTMVFDCNEGIVSFDYWQDLTVPFITSHVPRADGGWFPTHIWPINPYC